MDMISLTLMDKTVWSKPYCCNLLALPITWYPVRLGDKPHPLPISSSCLRGKQISYSPSLTLAIWRLWLEPKKGKTSLGLSRSLEDPPREPVQCPGEGRVRLWGGKQVWRHSCRQPPSMWLTGEPKIKEARGGRLSLQPSSYDHTQMAMPGRARCAGTIVRAVWTSPLENQLLFPCQFAPVHLSCAL